MARTCTMHLQFVGSMVLRNELRTLIDSGASNNFVRAQIMTFCGVSLSYVKEEIIIRLANRSRMKTSKLVIRLAMKFSEFPR
ncbi:hypothetical protein Plhal304r1_c062g0149461 [Plasmopara halstedii]